MPNFSGIINPYLTTPKGDFFYFVALFFAGKLFRKISK